MEKLIIKCGLQVGKKNKKKKHQNKIGEKKIIENTTMKIEEE